MVIVHKFGGTSIGSPDRFARVADIVLAHHCGYPTGTGASRAGTPSIGRSRQTFWVGIWTWSSPYWARAGIAWRSEG